MSVRNWAALVLGTLVCGGTAGAQQQYSAYGWRATTPVAHAPQSRSGLNEHLIADPQSARWAELPAYRQGPYLQQEQDDPNLIDRQPSPSDQTSQPLQPPVDDAQAKSKLQLDNQPMVSSLSAPAAPQVSSGINNQPGLAVADRGDPLPEIEAIPGWCNLGCERKLFGTSPNGLSMGGWTQLGAHSENSLGFNDREDELNLHQQWLFVEKRPRCQNGWGYRADMLYGIDAQNTQAFGNPVTGAPDGWDNDWDHGSYGWALPQAYVSYRDCCWDVKLGKFFSPFGFESIASPQNFFYSRSYARTFIEPFTVSGVLAERRVSDQRSLLLGATAGWETAFDQNSSGFNVIAGQRSNFGQNVSLASTLSLGNTGYRGEGWMNTQVLQIRMSKKTRYVLQGDLLNLGTNQEFAIVNYLFHDFNPCLKAGTRLEWWKSDQIFPDTRSTWSLTNGLNFRPHANLTIRPETRLDWGAAAIDPGQLIVGVDAILTF